MEGSVYALASYDDGTGPALFAAGDFTAIDAQPAGPVARRDGSSWTDIGSALEPGFANDSEAVTSLVVRDDGTGAVLVAAGDFEGVSGTFGRVAGWEARAGNASRSSRRLGM
jgi:hypothetical protein